MVKTNGDKMFKYWGISEMKSNYTFRNLDISILAVKEMFSNGSNLFKITLLSAKFDTVLHSK